MNDRNVDLDETLADLFGAERRHPGPPPGAQDRIRAAVAASIGAAVVTGSGAAAATATTTTAGSGAVATSTTAAATSGALTTTTVATSGLVAKLGSGAAVVAALAATVGGGVFVNSYQLEPEAVVVVDEAPARPSPPPGLVVADDVASLLDASPAPPSVTTAKPIATAAKRSEPAAPVVIEEAPAVDVVVDGPARSAALTAERRQLTVARAALSAGDGRQALALLDGHRVTWPTGQLVEEREALIVLALASLHKDADARAAAAGFRATYPRSLFLYAIDRAVP